MSFSNDDSRSKYSLQPSLPLLLLIVTPFVSPFSFTPFPFMLDLQGKKSLSRGLSRRKKVGEEVELGGELEGRAPGS